MLMIVHLEAEPKQIVSNRSNDTSRSRPSYDVMTIEQHQDISREHAKSIATELNVEFFIVTHDDVEYLGRRIRDHS